MEVYGELHFEQQDAGDQRGRRERAGGEGMRKV